MTKAGGIFTTIMAAAALVAVATPSNAAARTKAYDGLWSVSIFTKQGPCSTYRYPARIVSGVVQQAEPDFTYNIAGGVNASGGIVVTVSSGGQSATGHGRLSQRRGVGTWAAAGGQCSGTWSAERRI
jgi:hypothetical protein